MVARLAHPLAGEVPVVASPMRFSRTRVEPGRPPPLLGEHTDAVLRHVLGSSDAEIARWRSQGAI
jgi:crotonobetainyl-CoA:carnitine CoA-transferase CaiB-like acyl-CoA transferase